MILIKAENRELALSISINQRNPKPEQKPWHGVLLGTDFRHAVEFSKSGRATSRPSRAPLLAGCPPLRRFPAAPHRGTGPADLPVRAAHGEPYTTGRGSCRGVRSQTPRKLSIPTVRP